MPMMAAVLQMTPGVVKMHVTSRWVVRRGPGELHGIDGG